MSQEADGQETIKKLEMVKSVLVEGINDQEVQKIETIFQPQIQDKKEQEIRTILDLIFQSESDKTRGEFDKYYNKLSKSLTAGEMQLALFLIPNSDRNTALYYWLMFRSTQEMQKNKSEQDQQNSLKNLFENLVAKIRRS